MGERLQLTLKNLISFPGADVLRGDVINRPIFFKSEPEKQDLRKDFSQPFLVQEALWKILFFF